MTEQYLRERYRWTRAAAADHLMRAVREGWAERKEGYGWRFLPVAKTPDAFDQIYRFRMAIEPAAMLEPSFEIDRQVLDRLKRVQEGMITAGIETMSAERLVAHPPKTERHKHWRVYRRAEVDAEPLIELGREYHALAPDLPVLEARQQEREAREGRQ